jgi:hypothetical protein
MHATIEHLRAIDSRDTGREAAPTGAAHRAGGATPGRHKIDIGRSPVHDFALGEFDFKAQWQPYP